MTELSIRPDEIRDALQRFVSDYKPDSAAKEEVGTVAEAAEVLRIGIRPVIGAGPFDETPVHLLVRLATLPFIGPEGLRIDRDRGVVGGAGCGLCVCVFCV